MKKRMGYVSNSSSSSFLLQNRMDLSEIEKIMKSIVDFYGDEEFNESCYSIREITPYFISEMKKRGFDYDSDYAVEGNYRITAVDDNSIPYDLFGIIEKKLDAHYFHIGYDFEM